jgi:hypothetical protein
MGEAELINVLVEACLDSLVDMVAARLRCVVAEIGSEPFAAALNMSEEENARCMDRRSWSIGEILPLDSIEI